jgi:hypothetical protein
MGASRDRGRLAMRFGTERGRAHIRHPNLDRAEALRTQPLRCARTFVREGLGFEAETMTNLRIGYM